MYKDPKEITDIFFHNNQKHSVISHKNTMLLKSTLNLIINKQYLKPNNFDILPEIQQKV